MGARARLNGCVQLQAETGTGECTRKRDRRGVSESVAREDVTIATMPTARFTEFVRTLEPSVLAALACRSDAIAERLGRRFGMVAWDRERVIGSAQRQFQQLRHRDIAQADGTVHVRERSKQPLESLAVVWRALRAGNHVHLHLDPDADPTVAELLAPVADQLTQRFSPQLLVIEPDATACPTVVGVHPAHTRIAIVEADADRELASYLLARVSLRRTGLDPRAVKRVFVCGDVEALLQRLRRLWLGVTVGPADDHRSFAGPLPHDIADAFMTANTAFRQHPDIRVLCPGERLDVGDPNRAYVAPALVATPWDSRAAVLERLDGPVLAVHAFEHPLALDEALAHEHLADDRKLVIGDATSPEGALMVERLPPGMPHPRPL